MDLSEVLSLDCTLRAVQCSSKKRALELLSEVAAAKLGVDHKELFNCFLGREKMGSTGIGAGIAIPHARIGDEHPAIAILMTLEEAIDFDAIDKQPVDLLFALLVPASQCQAHLATLGAVAAKLQDRKFCRELRCATSDEQLYQLMTGPN